MAHANPGTVEQSDHNHLDKFQLPMYYHGNTTKSHDSSSEHEAVTPLYVLGIPLHKFSRTFQFLVCMFGVMFFYLLYGYTQVDGLVKGDTYNTNIFVENVSCDGFVLKAIFGK